MTVTLRGAEGWATLAVVVLALVWFIVQVWREGVRVGRHREWMDRFDRDHAARTSEDPAVEFLKRCTPCQVSNHDECHLILDGVSGDCCCPGGPRG